jgi:hypothetical protein
LEIIMTAREAISPSCQICSALVEGVWFTQEESTTILFKGAKRKQIVALRCPACGAAYCDPAHKKTLGFSLFDGYSRRTCRACGAVFGKHEYVFSLPLTLPPELEQRIHIVMQGSAIHEPELQTGPQITPIASAAHELADEVRYRLTATSLGNPLELEVSSRHYCVYCAHLSDPQFNDPRLPRGIAECSNFSSQKSVVALDDSCELWEPNTRVRFWLSRGYMENNTEGWPRKPWYALFDDGPDGEAGTRG